MITFSKATSGEVYLVYKPDFADSTWFQNELREQKKLHFREAFILAKITWQKHKQTTTNISLVSA